MFYCFSHFFFYPLGIELSNGCSPLWEWESKTRDQDGGKSSSRDQNVCHSASGAFSNLGARLPAGCVQGFGFDYINRNYQMKD